MTIRLIVNADDYGLTGGVSRGIREAHAHGIVTSTTAMMNMEAAPENIERALIQTPKLGLGVHLVLSAGKPVLPAPKVPSLVDANGDFHKQEVIIADPAKLNPAEAEAEFQAQIERFVASAGKGPTHLDSHHHMSYISEGIFAAMLKLAAKYDCAIRQPVAQDNPEGAVLLPGELVNSITDFNPRQARAFQVRHADGFFATFYDEGATKEALLKLLSGLKDGSFEIMTHPAYPDSDLHSSYYNQRQRELGILTDPDVRALIQARGIELISFAQL